MRDPEIRSRYVVYIVTEAGTKNAKRHIFRFRERAGSTGDWVSDDGRTLDFSHCWLQESRPQNWGEGRQLDRPDACAGSSAPVQEVFSHGIAALQGWKRRRFGEDCHPNTAAIGRA